MLFMRGRVHSLATHSADFSDRPVWTAASHHRVVRMNCCSSRRSGVAFARSPGRA